MRKQGRRGSLNFYQKPKKKFNKALFYEIVSWFIGIFVAIFLATICVFFFLIKTSMVGTSMEPTIIAGQSVYINQVAYNMSSPKRFDIIVFKPNGNVNSHNYIKRVIGLPGETIQIKDGKVYINGELLKDDVAIDTRDGGLASSELVIANDEYFVMGDNRLNSEDSRSANIGNVKTSMIEGKAYYRLKFGNFEAGRIK